MHKYGEEMNEKVKLFVNYTVYYYGYYESEVFVCGNSNNSHY